MKKYISAALLASVLVLSTTGCSSVIRNTSLAVHYTDTGVNELDDYPVIRSTGYAVISRQKGSSHSEKQINAMRASKMEAYRELTEQVAGVYVKAKNSNSNNIEKSDKLTTEVEGLVHGARVVRQYPLGDTYVTELELDTKRIYDMYQIRGAL
ncbi:MULTISPECIES: LPP20 family lipoprotein [unclassified Anaerobiospirillum]|uniref:LPP20 family lipoprotein n=1 Tax=unclassified Anaerobiospirillum TaxID=2647410 RepID=UPI001FF5FA1F|nr:MULTISPECIES: LPP20 family lipoprotein [unclassified Anaerobiospirillum]MCK0534324.1 hypothetical protein [Anaerobiospirillum sp. NML120511]MCK0539593.1 hypothetical protein [Anaerobiospirillum sp. NML02-A-032]